MIKGPDGDRQLLCGGMPMLSEPRASGAPALTCGPTIEIGKRYTDEEDAVEVLCTKPGYGPLAFGGRSLTLKAACASRL
jgi:hypothetical protein